MKLTKMLALLALSAAAAIAADVTGTWYFNVEMSIGSGTPTFQLKQEGTALTGTYNGTLGELPIKGKVDGDKIVITFEADAGGEKFTATYTGVIKGLKDMEGTVKYGTLADGTWKANRKE
jgi:hypothetical protein